MEAQQLLNVDFVSAHEQLRTNVNAFWGPESAPFRYMTSKWGGESSVEMLSNPDDSYQTPPVVGSLQWDHPQGVHLPGETMAKEAGATCLSARSWNSLSSVRADVVHLNLSDTRTDASDLKRTKPSGTSAHKR